MIYIFGMELKSWQMKVEVCYSIGGSPLQGGGEQVVPTRSRTHK